MFTHKNKIKVLLLFLLIYSTISSINYIHAQEYEIAQLTDNGKDNNYPQIHNGRVVWITEDDEILFYTGSNIIQLSDNASPYSGGPQIYDGQVVWVEWGRKIVLYNGSDKIQLGYGLVSYPQTHNGQVVWMADTSVGGRCEIFLYDGINVTKIGESDATGTAFPQIHNGQVVWAGKDDLKHRYEIFIYDGSSVRQLVNPVSYWNLSPKIYNGKVVWEGWDGHDSEIFLYDGSNVIQVTNNEREDSYPLIDNEQIAWTGFDGNDYEIFMYDQGSITQLTDNNYFDGLAGISNGQVVWYGNDGYYNSEIYLYDGTNILQLTYNNYHESSVDIQNGQVTWDANYPWNYNIFLAIPLSPPVLYPIGNREVNEGELLEFTISATDADVNDILTYSASNLPEGATFNTETKTFTWTPTYEQAGTYDNITFTVTDGSLTDEEIITITVNNINRSPELVSIGSKSVDEGALLEFTVSATDPDGDPIIYSALNLPQDATMDSQTGKFAWTPNYTQAGAYIVTFVVSDRDLSDGETITITVSNVPLPDISIGKIFYIPTIPRTHRPIFFIIEVQNIGEKSTGTFYVDRFIDGIYLGSTKIRTIRVGKRAYTFFYWWKTIKGNHIFKVVADPANKILESQEDNNTKEVSFYVR